jgi:hypothetical protein
VIANNGALGQMILPNFMRARGMAVHQMVFFGSMVVGSLLWGKIATCRSVQTALILSALSLVPLTVLAACDPAARRSTLPRLTRHCGCVFCTTRHQIFCRGEESLVTAYISCRYETKTPNARAAGP